MPYLWEDTRKTERRVYDLFKYSYTKVRKRRFIARQGDKVNSLYLLSKGSVKSEMITESEGVLSIEAINAPSLLASAFLFANNNYCCPIKIINIAINN